MEKYFDRKKKIDSILVNSLHFVIFFNLYYWTTVKQMNELINITCFYNQ